MPPFVLCILHAGEAILFASLQELESAIEQIDVANKEYLAYDSVGCVVDLSVDQFGAPRASLTGVGRETDLRCWILENYSSVPGITPVRTLSELIEILRAIYDYDGPST